MVLRCTTRLIDLLGKRAVTLVDDPAADDDWYANLLWIHRRKCLLLTHAGTLFPIFIADVRKADLQELLGHRDLKTTLIYADYAPSEREVEWVEAAFATPKIDEHHR